MVTSPFVGTPNRLALMEPNPGPLEAWLGLSGLVASVVSSTADWSHNLRHQPLWVGCSSGANKVLLASQPDEKSEWFYLSTLVRKLAQIIHKFKLSYQLPLAGMWRPWQELSLHSAVQNRSNNLCSASLLWKMLGELLESPAFLSVCLYSLLPKELINRQDNWLLGPEAWGPSLPPVP